MVPGITHLFVKIRGTVFENYILNVRTDIYTLFCSIDAHEKHQQSNVYYGSSGCGNVLPSNATTEALVSLSETFDFIYCWLEFFDHNYIEHSNMYNETMKGLFEKTPYELSKPQIPRGNHQSLLHDIGG